MKPKKHNKPAAPTALSDRELRDAALKQANKDQLLFFGSTMGLAIVQSVFLPHSFPCYPVVGIVCPIVLMVLGIALARQLEPSRGTAVVLSWRRRVRYVAFVLWFSGCLASYVGMGKEDYWIVQHGLYWKNWFTEAFSSSPRLADFVNGNRGTLELLFAFPGMPLLILWLSCFWPGYEESQKQEAS